MRKNKRKSSEFKKRMDFSIKRFCLDSLSLGSVCLESGWSEDMDNNNEDVLNFFVWCLSGMIFFEREEICGGY